MASSGLQDYHTLFDVTGTLQTVGSAAARVSVTELTAPHLGFALASGLSTIASESVRTLSLPLGSASADNQPHFLHDPRHVVETFLARVTPAAAAEVLQSAGGGEVLESLLSSACSTWGDSLVDCANARYSARLFAELTQASATVSQAAESQVEDLDGEVKSAVADFSASASSSVSSASSSVTRSIASCASDDEPGSDDIEPGSSKRPLSLDVSSPLLELNQADLTLRSKDLTRQQIADAATYSLLEVVPEIGAIEQNVHELDSAAAEGPSALARFASVALDFVPFGVGTTKAVMEFASGRDVVKASLIFDETCFLLSALCCDPFLLF